MQSSSRRKDSVEGGSEDPEIIPDGTSISPSWISLDPMAIRIATWYIQIRTLAPPDPKQAEKPSNSILSPERTLVLALTQTENNAAATIITTTTIQEQLQTLQNYRNRILLAQPNRQTAACCVVPEDNNDDDDDDYKADNQHEANDKIDDEEDQNHEPIFLYRLLLEWMWSAQTPLPLRRAVASCLHNDCFAKKNHPQQRKQRISTMIVQILRSIVAPSADENNNNNNNEHDCWSDPLHSLQQALTWKPLLSEHLMKIDPVLRNVWTFLEHTSTDANSSFRVIQLASIIETLLAWNMETLDQMDASIHHSQLALSHFFRKILLDHYCPIPESDIPIVSIAYGRLLISISNQGEEIRMIQNVLFALLPEWTECAQAAVLHGLATAVPLEPPSKINSGNERLEVDRSPHWLSQILQISVVLAKRTSNPGARLLTLKTVRIVLNRLPSASSKEFFTICSDSNVLQLVLSTWEDPPNRQIAHIVPVLFELYVQHVILKQNSDEPLNDLLREILNQPLSRKGRYLAIQTLLPIMGAQKLLDQSLSHSSIHSSLPSKPSNVIQDLLHGIGDIGDNTFVIADLWAKFLHQLLITEMKTHTNFNTSLIVENTHGSSGAYSLLRPNRKERRKQKQQNNSVQAKESHGCGREIEPVVLPLAWVGLWVPGLAKALVSVDLTRRKQVASFCLPRVVTMTSAGNGPLSESVMAYDALLRKINELQDDLPAYDPPTQEREMMMDRIMWAKLEVTRFVGKEGLLKSSSRTSVLHLRETLATCLPINVFQHALSHFLSSVRVLALQALEVLVPVYGGLLKLPTELDIVLLEADFWKYALPYCLKADGPEYTIAVLSSLFSFLDRMSFAEAKSHLDRKTAQPTPEELPLLLSFVSDYLLGSVVTKLAGYPGTVASKESFMLSLLECILVFAERNHPLAVDSRLSPKTSPAMRRKRLDAEQVTMKEIQRALLGREVFGSLFSLLHSIWDGTRSRAYFVSLSLLKLCQMCSIATPAKDVYFCSLPNIDVRALFLASSPRQREADTGARLLAISFSFMTTSEEKHLFLTYMASFLEDRLAKMKVCLSCVLDKRVSGDAHKDILPLAHGIIHSICLITENHEEAQFFKRSDSKEILEKLTSLFCQSIMISLAVVADVYEGVKIEGVDKDLAAVQSTRVNPGNIGANGIFSSVKHASKQENARRLVSQRIIIGSWLLTREACSAIAAILTKNIELKNSFYEYAGKLLISTLTSLKHTGAAFAAHRSLQKISLFCLQQGSNAFLLQLPHQWSSRLLDEISIDKVRDSTLRRSLGYSLGLTAIMRSEVSSVPSSPRKLCYQIIKRLFVFSLPSQQKLIHFLEKIKMPAGNIFFLFASLSENEPFTLVSSSEYQKRSRVIALNACRQIILDAPLSLEIFPFVGVAFVASVIGYTDAEWSVRNSSTMLFAAAMLRSVDPDKNAFKKDRSHNSATSLHEFFRSFPYLSPFFLSVLEGGIKHIFQDQRILSLPPILPILLLLARVQSVVTSGTDSISSARPFIPLVCLCLDHKDISIRKVAARALANLTSGQALEIIQHLQLALSALTTKTLPHWNRLHGSLLAAKEIVRRSVEAEGILSNHDVLEDIFCLTVIKEGRTSVPLPCIIPALDILELVCIGNDRRRLLESCMFITTWLESIRYEPSYLIGSPELACCASSIATRVIAEAMWNDFSCIDDVRQSMNQLASLLLSPCIDVRLWSTKTFKKTIYCGIDNVARCSNSCNELLVDLSELFVKVLRQELSRDSISSDSSHSPTLRRISRCLLECIDAISTCGAKFEEPIGSLALSLLRKNNPEICRLDFLSSLTELDANATELFSCYYLSSGQIGNNDDDLLFPLISRLANPVNTWRMRHCAALALRRTCRFSRLDAAKDLPTSTLRQILLSWIELMQDEDVDVRYAASKIFSESGMPFESRASEFAFFRGLQKVCMLFPSFLIAEGFSWRILQISDGLAENITTIASEVIQRKNHDETFLTNLEEEKKIFEEEEPNTYAEICLVSQLMTVSMIYLCGASTKLLPDGSYPRSTDLISQTKKILMVTLNILKGVSQSDASDILQEVSRDGFLFPHLHSLLLWCGAVLYAMGAHGNEVTIQQLAADIVPFAGNAAHPSFLDALNALAFSEYRCSAAADRLTRSCFLLQFVAAVKGFPSNVTKRTI
jgi:hypothetical protein